MQGKYHSAMGPLMVEAGQNRRNAQVFVADPELDAAQVISNNVFVSKRYSE